jgi:hypothetical protein
MVAGKRWMSVWEDGSSVRGLTKPRCVRRRRQFKSFNRRVTRYHAFENRTRYTEPTKQTNSGSQAAELNRRFVGLDRDVDRSIRLTMRLIRRDVGRAGVLVALTLAAVAASLACNSMVRCDDDSASIVGDHGVWSPDEDRGEMLPAPPGYVSNDPNQYNAFPQCQWTTATWLSIAWQSSACVPREPMASPAFQ